MKILHGRTRMVILTKRYAVKIPQMKKFKNFLLGLLSNMQEVAISKSNDERLCPVKFYLPFGLLLIMPKCDMISVEFYDNMDKSKFWPNESEDYHPKNMCERAILNAPVENKPDSFGRYNNKIVAIDYGS